MSLITIRNSLLVAAVITLSSFPGCSKQYERERLDNQSQRMEEFRAMLASLRSSDGEALKHCIERQMAGQLTDRQKQALEATLGEIAAAEQVHIRHLDRFGEKVYRASLELVTGRERRTVPVLLVEADGELRWAGRN